MNVKKLLAVFVLLTALRAARVEAIGDVVLPPDMTSCGNHAYSPYSPDSCGGPPVPWVIPSLVFFEGDVLALTRDAAHNVAFATLNTPTDVVLRSETAPAPFRAAMRLRGGLMLDELTSVEGLYFGLSNWTADDAVRDQTPNALGGTGNLFSPFTNFGNPPVAGLDYNNFVSIRNFSTLDNAEINLRRRLPTPPWIGISALFGVRYLNIRERFDYLSNASVPTPLGATNHIQTKTGNDLIGLQIGGQTQVSLGEIWWTQFEIKGAICNNAAGQRTVYTNTDSTGVTQSFVGSHRAGVTTFVGDLALSVNCQCSAHISAQVGYQALFVEGLALAAENVSSNIGILTSGPASVVHNGRVIYHGPTAGLTIGW